MVDRIARRSLRLEHLGQRISWLLVVCMGLGMCLPAAQARRQSTMRAQLKAEFTEAVTSALDVSGAHIEITDIKAASPELLNARVRIDRFELTRTRRPVGRVTARVTYWKDKQSVLTWVHAKVAAEVPVWVMSANVERGAPVHRSAHVEMRDAARLPVDVLTGDASLMGRISARRLRNGAPLTRSALTTHMLVRRGDQVKVTVFVGTVQIAANGTAMRDGRIGQSIPVRVRQGRLIQAAVAGPRRLEVRR